MYVDSEWSIKYISLPRFKKNDKIVAHIQKGVYQGKKIGHAN